MLQAVRAAAPDLPLHASTQMTVHNTDGALQAREMGLQRVVLAVKWPKNRSPPYAPWKALKPKYLSMAPTACAYSGQCAMRRPDSAGAAAPGHLRPALPPALYTLEGQDNRYPLSLKDMSLADHIPELTAMGISCLKLEGRMKLAGICGRGHDHLCRAAARNRRPQPRSWDLEAAFSAAGTGDKLKGKPTLPCSGARRKNAGAKELFAHVRTEYERCEHRSIPVSMALCARGVRAV